jgi:pyrroloquinoline quinone (PQQ) biosynthesis protein C
MTRDTELPDQTVSEADRTSRAALSNALFRAVEGRALLTHPFYRRWEAGRLAPEELAEYAVHYREFEAALPVVLGAVAEALTAEGKHEAAALVRRNLADELGRPEPHLALFDRFADGLGADTARSAGPAATALVAAYHELADEGPEAALAGLAAYETQAAAVAASKADGLRRFYGVGAAGTEFWEVHATMDADHGEWTIDGLAQCGAEPSATFRAARRAADAWWALLDEREAEAPGSAELCSHH